MAIFISPAKSKKSQRPAKPEQQKEMATRVDLEPG